MTVPPMNLTRRDWIRGAAACGLAAPLLTPSVAAPAGSRDEALVAITLDLEMSRNFPTWDAMHWDYEKGNLDDPTKAYAVEAARRVKAHGGKLHFFVVGRVLEQPDVSWLETIRDAGHPIGNHTYDHINVRSERPEQLQFRFQRAPWLIDGKTVEQVIAENIRLTTTALRQRVGITPDGFRTPGGFHDGLKDFPRVRKLIRDQGFSWVSSLYPPHPYGRTGEPPSEETLNGIVAAQTQAQPFRYPDGLIELPMNPISDVGAFRSARWPLDGFLEAIRRSLAWVIEHGAVFDFLAHPSCLVATDPKFRAIDLICEMVEKSKGRARIVGLSDVAARV